MTKRGGKQNKRLLIRYFINKNNKKEHKADQEVLLYLSHMLSFLIPTDKKPKTCLLSVTIPPPQKKKRTEVEKGQAYSCTSFRESDTM